MKLYGSVEGICKLTFWWRQQLVNMIRSLKLTVWRHILNLQNVESLKTDFKYFPFWRQFSDFCHFDDLVRWSQNVNFQFLPFWRVKASLQNVDFQIVVILTNCCISAKRHLTCPFYASVKLGWTFSIIIFNILIIIAFPLLLNNRKNHFVNHYSIHLGNDNPLKAVFI